MRNRRRPAKTSTNAATIRKRFSNEPRKELPIPVFIDDYNFNIGGVNIANQNRQPYDTQRRCRRVWKPLLYWILDQAIVNAYHLAKLKQVKKTAL